MHFSKLRLIMIMLAWCSASSFANSSLNPLSAFKDNAAWTSTTSASTVSNSLQINNKKSATDNIIVYQQKAPPQSASNHHLVSRLDYRDSVVSMEYLATQGSTAHVFLQGRYAVALKNNNNEWQTLNIKFRAPRFNEASQKIQPALFLEIRINGEPVSSNQIIHSNSDNAFTSWESDFAPTTLLVTQGELALRNIAMLSADFSALLPPKSSGDLSNLSELVDFVALGKETFEAVGCTVCHSITANNSAVNSGPTLFGLFTREPRTREILDNSGSEQHRFHIKADRAYLQRSLRAPTEQLAIGESGAKKDEAYPTIMPAFSQTILSDIQVDAIGAYLSTLNAPAEQGPAIHLIKPSGMAQYNPLDDRLQLLVDDQVRIQRGPLAGDIKTGVSGRAIHVGLVNGINYSFDPRILAITKIWQGGFLDMTGEFTHRGGKGLKLGYASQEINVGEQPYLFAPLNAAGKLIDFSFKEAKFGDVETIKTSLNSTQDHLAHLAEIDAQFLGYTRNSSQTKKAKHQAPRFRYRVGQNNIAVQTTVDSNGDLRIHIKGHNKTAQTFSLNSAIIKQPKTTTGQLQNNLWTLPEGKINATLHAKIALANTIWHAPKSLFNYYKQPLTRSAATANLPAGYRIENYYPPKDNFGREQLFEALGLASTADGTLIVATRTAGIWRLVKNEWQLFAEGTFDSLGLVIEQEVDGLKNKKGLTIVVGQKAELTRISDTNGDGIADDYETLFDAHAYHGNYHAYLHGPVRGADGAYYININLADGDDGATYKAGGAYMGSTGGFSGWNIRVEPSGKTSTLKFTPWANGLRSPAGMALSPEGQLWYSENQGEYVGTSKLFIIEQNAFYGHPASLIDLPGTTPASAHIAWNNVSNKRALPIILLPHNRVANSPGNPSWDTTQGKFGAFAGQMLIGDQTQSTVARVSTQRVDGVMQGSVMPFISGLESGVMRSLFLTDGSLLLGQTGRGWQAKGGHVASLQRIIWNGETIAPAIKKMDASAQGFVIEFTQPLQEKVTNTILKHSLRMESWVYRDAPEYGSDELDKQQNLIKDINISSDRKKINIELTSLNQPFIHPQQTARVYHASISAKELFNLATEEQMDAYYTLYKFPSSAKTQ